MKAYTHHQGATSGSDQDRFATGTAFGGTGWHTAVIQWTPSALRYYLDDRLIGTSTSRIPSSPMHWVLQTETSIKEAAPADATGGHVLIDWVAVYKLS